MSFGFGLGLPQNYVASLFTPAQLFSTGVQGVWYDPSDMSTLFQDSAGTTPVTAVEQPVGKMLDKSGRGNHATQATAGNRPTLSARYNLLTKTEQFDDAAWSKTNASVSVVSGQQKLVENATSNLHYVSQTPTILATTALFLFQAKAAERKRVMLRENSVSGAYAIIDLSAATVIATAGGMSATVTVTSDGWCACAISRNYTVAGATQFGIFVMPDTATSFADATYLGDGTSGIYLKNADFRPTNESLNQPAYQRVNTSTDYDTVGFKPYLSFNGTSSSMATNSINFSATDKMFVSAGVRKLSDATTGVIAELSNSLSGNNGVVSAIAPSGSNLFAWYSKGTVLASALTVDTAYTAPKTVVMSGIGDIGGTNCTMRLNGAASTNSASQGTGAYGNYPLYIGARGGGSLFLNGRLYQLIVSGKAATSTEIVSTELFVNQRTGAY